MIAQCRYRYVTNLNFANCPLDKHILMKNLTSVSKPMTEFSFAYCVLFYYYMLLLSKKKGSAQCTLVMIHEWMIWCETIHLCMSIEQMTCGIVRLMMDKMKWMKNESSSSGVSVLCMIQIQWQKRDYAFNDEYTECATK